MSDPHIILGVHITDRLKNAVDVQKVFTEFGCNIKTRVGLHDVGEQRLRPRAASCSSSSSAPATRPSAMTARLDAVEGVERAEDGVRALGDRRSDGADRRRRTEAA